MSTDVWPNPIRPEAFHGIAGEFVRLVEEHTEADPVGLLLTFLAAAGSAIGNGPSIDLSGTRHTARIWPVLVGSTASGRKGTSLPWVKAVIEKADPTWSACHASNVGSGEAVIWHVRDPITTTDKDGKESIIDTGAIDKRLFIVESEFASVLKVASRDGSVLSPILRTAWDSDRLVHTTKHNPATATGAHIVVVGHITPEELARELRETDRSNGFGNRFMFVMVRRTRVLPRGGSLPEGVLDGLAARLADVLPVARATHRLAHTEAFWQEYEPRYRSLSEPPPTMAGAMQGRGAPYVHRLAMLFALLDGERAIDGQHARAALAVWDYCRDSVYHLFANGSGDPLRDRLYGAILDAGGAGLTRTNLRDRLSRHGQKGDVERALDKLMTGGLVVIEKVPTAGSPTTIYRATEATKATEAPTGDPYVAYVAHVAPVDDAAPTPQSTKVCKGCGDPWGGIGSICEGCL
ncbi:MAG: DUF3987 domain-containing protein [Mycobacterium sp.]